MDISHIHEICKSETRKAFEDFKHYLNNALWQVDGSIINVEIETMKASIGQGVNKKVMGIYTLNDKQLLVLQNIIDHYKGIAVRTALNYSKKFL